jgi:glycerophosphoryl diester phosphodiesterase
MGVAHVPLRRVTHSLLRQLNYSGVSVPTLAEALAFAQGASLGLQLELKEQTNYRAGASCLLSRVPSLLVHQAATRPGKKPPDPTRGCPTLRSDSLIGLLLAELRRLHVPRDAIVVSSFEPMRLVRFLALAAGDYPHTKLVLDAVLRRVPSVAEQQQLFSAIRNWGIDSVSVLPRAANANMVRRAQVEFGLAVEIGLPSPRSRGQCIHEQPLHAAGMNESAVQAVMEMRPNVICTDRPDLVHAVGRRDL